MSRLSKLSYILILRWLIKRKRRRWSLKLYLWIRNMIWQITFFNIFIFLLSIFFNILGFISNLLISFTILFLFPLISSSYSIAIYFIFKILTKPFFLIIFETTIRVMILARNLFFLLNRMLNFINFSIFYFIRMLFK